MAEKVKIDPGLFASTEPGQEVEVPATGPIKPVSVGLKKSELDMINEIAARYQVARNALMRIAARRFIADVIAGRIDLEPLIVEPEPPPPKRKMIIP